MHDTLMDIGCPTGQLAVRPLKLGGQHTYTGVGANLPFVSLFCSVGRGYLRCSQGLSFLRPSDGEYLGACAAACDAALLVLPIAVLRRAGSPCGMAIRLTPVRHLS